MVSSGRNIRWITGDIGVGKTYVCEIIAKLAYRNKIPCCVISIDDIRRDIISFSHEQEDEQIRHALEELLWPSIISSNNTIDRIKLATIILADPTKNKQYKNIVWPRINHRIQQKIDDTIPSTLVIVEWAWLVEDDMLHTVDNKVVRVQCDPAIQHKRIAGIDLSNKQIAVRKKYFLSASEKQAIFKQKGTRVIVYNTTNNPGEKEINKLFLSLMKG